MTTENEHVGKQIEHVAQTMEEVTSSADETLENCNTNLASIAKVAALMDGLKEEAAKLKSEE